MAPSGQSFWKNYQLSKVGPFVLALLGALLFAYVGTWTPALAQESPLATPVPEATPVPAVTAAPAFVPMTLPSISGVARSDHGELLTGIIVTAYRRQLRNWTTARQTTTNDAGEYRFPWMPAATYRLYFRDPQGIYASIYYPNGGDIEEAGDVVISGSSVAGLDAQIGAGGQISGTLTWADGPDAFNSTVKLYYVTAAPITTQLTSSDRLNLAPELRQYRLVATKSFTESVVSYGFKGLAAGNYRVCAEAVALRATQSECFDNAALGIHATNVVVVAGATVGDVAIVLGDKADLATLTGNVTLADGTPASGVDVETSAVPDVDFFASAQGQRTTTDEAGNFRLERLPFGRYVVRFSDADGLYLPSDYRAIAEATAASEIALERSSEVSISAVVTRAALILGHVMLDGSNAGMGGQVAAYGLGPEGWFIGGTGNIVAATGAYTVTGLRGNNYRLQYNVEIPVAIFYGTPGATLETATEIAVVTGTTTGGIDVDLTPYLAGVAYGSISGAVLAEGVPQPAMLVRVYDAAFDCCIAPPTLLVTTTDVEGRFMVAGLPPGRYKIGISAPGQPASTLFAPDQRTYEMATGYFIGNPAEEGARQSITDVNMTMGPVGNVARRILRPDDRPVVGAIANIYQRLGEPGSWPLVASTLTNDEGRYTFAGLAPDIYQVCIVAVGIVEPSCNGRGGQGMGLDVVVTAGQEATGIDILDIP